MKEVNWITIRDTEDGFTITGRSSRKWHVSLLLIAVPGILFVFQRSTQLMFFGGILFLIAFLVTSVIVLTTYVVQVDRFKGTIVTSIKYLGFKNSAQTLHHIGSIRSVSFDYRTPFPGQSQSLRAFTLAFDDGKQFPFMVGDPNQLWRTSLELQERLEIAIRLKLASPDRIITPGQAYSWLPEEKLQSDPSQFYGQVTDANGKRVIKYSDRSYAGVLIILLPAMPILLGMYLSVKEDDLSTYDPIFLLILLSFFVGILVYFILSVVVALSPGFIELSPDQISMGLVAFGIKVGTNLDVSTLIHLFVTDEIRKGKCSIFALSSTRSALSLSIRTGHQAQLVYQFIINYYQSI